MGTGPHPARFFAYMPFDLCYRYERFGSYILGLILLPEQTDLAGLRRSDWLIGQRFDSDLLFSFLCHPYTVVWYLLFSINLDLSSVPSINIFIRIEHSVKEFKNF